MNDVFLTTARLRAIAHWKIQNHINELEMNIDPNWNNGIGFDKNYLTQSKLVFFWGEDTITNNKANTSFLQKYK